MLFFVGLGHQSFVIEVVDSHCLAYVMQSCSSSSFSFLAACTQDFINLRDALLPIVTALTDGLQHVLQHVVEELLNLYVTQTTALVVSLQLVQVSIVRQKFGKVLFSAESVQIGENSIAFNLTGIT